MIKQQQKDAKKVDENINLCFYSEPAPLTRDVKCSKLQRDREIRSGIILSDEHTQGKRAY